MLVSLQRSDGSEELTDMSCSKACGDGCGESSVCSEVGCVGDATALPFNGPHLNEVELDSSGRFSKGGGA